LLLENEKEKKGQKKYKQGRYNILLKTNVDIILEDRKAKANEKLVSLLEKDNDNFLQKMISSF